MATGAPVALFLCASVKVSRFFLSTGDRVVSNLRGVCMEKTGGISMRQGSSRGFQEGTVALFHSEDRACSLGKLNSSQPRTAQKVHSDLLSHNTIENAITLLKFSESKGFDAGLISDRHRFVAVEL